MKKTYYLLLFVLVLSSAVKAQTGWVAQNLDDRLSVKFPEKPVVTTVNNINVYSYKAKDSLAYSAAIVDFMVVAHLDSATLAPMKDNPQFAEQLKMGMASSKPNYTLSDVTIGKWKTYTVYSITGTENKTKNTLYINMILIGSKMYTLSCRVPAGMVTKNNELYYASADLVKK